MNGTATRTDDKFVLRLPDGLRDRLAKSAAENCRSMNSEAVFHLDRALPLRFLEDVAARQTA